MTLVRARSWPFLLAVACNSDLELSLEGKQCSADDRCVDGYQCNREANVCVRRDLLPVGGSSAGHGPSAAGHGGRGQGGRGQGGNGSGASPGAGDAGEMELGGSAGAGADGGDGPLDLDAGQPDASDSDAGCVPVQLYRDRDGDGVGDTATQRLACPAPGWVTTPGDCRDDQPRVYLGQTEFFGVPYPDPLAPGGISFDFDCVGGEQADPLNAPPTGAPSCGDLLDPVVCSGTGYLPLSPARGGEGFEPLCGSVTQRDCTPGTLSCNVTDSPAEAFRCR